MHENSIYENMQAVLSSYYYICSYFIGEKYDLEI